MPGATTKLLLPYPLGNETVDVAGDIKKLAEAIDIIANLTLTVTGTDLLAWAFAQTRGGYFTINNTVTAGVPVVGYYDGFLEVPFAGGQKLTITSRLTPYTTYTNVYVSGAWAGWIELAKKSDLDPALTALTVTGTDLFTWANAQTKKGYFTVPTSVTTNVPFVGSFNGMLETAKLTLTYRAAPFTSYVSVLSGGVWSAWAKQAMQKDIDDHATLIQHFGGTGGKAIDGNDLNNALAHGIYAVNTTTLNKPADFPANYYGSVIVANNGPNSRCQILVYAHPSVVPAMWLRTNADWTTNPTWGSWYRQATKADLDQKTIKSTGTLPITGWTDVGSGDYAKQYAFAIAGVTALDFVDVALHRDFLDTAQDAEICPSCESYAGGIRFYAKTVPALEIPFSYIVFK